MATAFGTLILTLLAALVGALVWSWAPDRPVHTLVVRWAPLPSYFVTLQGMQVHVRDEGPRDDPTPIVLIHGTSASLHTWDGWVAAFSPHRRVIRMDLPGFGLTGPAPDGDYSMARYTGFMRDLLDLLKLDEVVMAVTHHQKNATPSNDDCQRTQCLCPAGQGNCRQTWAMCPKKRPLSRR